MLSSYTAQFQVLEIHKTGHQKSQFDKVSLLGSNGYGEIYGNMPSLNLLASNDNSVLNITHHCAFKFMHPAFKCIPIHPSLFNLTGLVNANDIMGILTGISTCCNGNFLNYCHVCPYTL